MIQPMIFFIKEAFIGMKRSYVMTLVSMMTVSIALIVFGFFLLLSLNMSNFANLMTKQLEIRVFLKDSLTVQEINSFEEKLSAIKGIRQLTFVDKEEAWTSFNSNFKNLNLDNTLSQNPLPHSYRVTIFKDYSIPKIAVLIQKFDYYVEELVYGGEISTRIETFSKLTKTGGILLVSLLGLATLLIIVNTIRLTILARQEEISIMRLVGATDRFIKGPFIIEGFLMGIVGATFSVFVLYFSYDLGGQKLQESIPFFPLIVNPEQIQRIYILVACIGTLIGVFGAYLSVSKSLRKELS